MFITFERIKELAKNQGLSINSLEEKLGYSRNTIYAIKRNQPGAEKLQQLADYFGVSTDYLLGRTDNPNIAREETYTTPDGRIVHLDDLASNVMMFGGKKISEADKEIIKGIIKGYMDNKQ